MISVTSVKNMRKSDADTIASGVSARCLMARAGNAIFEAVTWKPPVAIVCGVGNNAGDGFAVAALLARSGTPCEVFMLSHTVSDTSRYFYDEARALSVSFNDHMTKGCLDGFGTVLDCIFGTGFHGEIAEPYRSAIEEINRCSAYVVSADINSGLDGEGGLYELCVHSDLTLSVGTHKSGLFLGGGKDVIKEKLALDIGIRLTEPPFGLIEARDIAGLFENRKNNSNKGDYGYVCVVGGSRQYSGAAKLANMSLAALRSGAGVSKLAVPDCIADGVMPYILESTLFPLDSMDGAYKYCPETARRLMFGTKAMAVGMGMGRSDDVGRLIAQLTKEYDGRLIIDADGLNSLADMGTEVLKGATCPVILTPHPKEFERLSGISVREILNDPITHARKFAAEHGVILLLKGASTVITDGVTVYITDQGCAGMATAGSGDVLSGILAGICGHVKDGELLLGIAAGAYLAGLAGEIAAADVPEAAMTARDTVAAIPAAMKKIISARA